MEPLRSSDPARIADHRLLGRLGAGGMGVVYLARTPGGALVALKVLLAEYAEEPGFKERFRREVEIARRVDSPWAVPLVDADPDAEAPWLATAFVPGPSLGEAVVAHGPLTEPGVRLIGARLAEALGEVHRAGLVHRDLKPGNVLIAHDGPRLIDFGIARAPEDTALTATGLVVGTPGYLSPEQAMGPGGDGIGPASDVFSLGCVLAFAATGRAPFGRGAVDALLYRAVHDPADLDGMPPRLREVVEACLEKEPARRPEAAELVRRLTAGDDPRTAVWADGGPQQAAASGWLPEPVARLIAERSAAALALPDIEHTQAPSDALPEPDPAQPGTGGTADSGRAAPGTGETSGSGRPEADTQGTSGSERAEADTRETSGSGAQTQDAHPAGRRRFLLLAGGAVALTAAGG
ncbi:serine/threonine-protein kinase, partial [Streptomyces sp. IBSBF 2806]|uniref:serine/threonine-protein kinase n=1 Tax=Streptomyces sp. IBSBF 2806 TaxID=2903529 RepID=UPI002FDC34F0